MTFGGCLLLFFGVGKALAGGAFEKAAEDRLKAQAVVFTALFKPAGAAFFVEWGTFGEEGTFFALFVGKYGGKQPFVQGRVGDAEKDIAPGTALGKMFAVAEAAVGGNDNGLPVRICHAVIGAYANRLMVGGEILRYAQLFLYIRQAEKLFVQGDAVRRMLCLKKQGEVKAYVGSIGKFRLDIVEKSLDTGEILGVDVDTHIYFYALVGKVMHSTHGGVVVMARRVEIALAELIVSPVAVKGHLHPAEMPHLFCLTGERPCYKAGVGYHIGGKGHFPFAEGCADAGDYMGGGGGFSAEPVKADLMSRTVLADESTRRSAVSGDMDLTAMPSS